jgi:hypothetical protein
MVTEGIFSGVKRSKHEADHPTGLDAEVKNGGVIPSLSHMSS